MKIRLLLLFGFNIILYSFAVGQEVVYPGDANNNGHVDHYDVLSIGYAYGSVGPIRLDTSAIGGSQNILVYWNENFPDGLNYSHADANNNGHVDFLDFFTLSLNNGISFTDVEDLMYSDEIPGESQATIELEQDGPFDPAFISGQELEIPVNINNLPAGTLINGVALNLVYDPNFFTVFDFEFSDEWINEDNGSFTIISESPGQIHLGITRFGIDPVEGDGTIGVLRLTIIEDLVGLLPNIPDTTIGFVEVSGVQLYDQDFELVPTNIDAMSLINSLPLNTSGNSTTTNKLGVIAVPNPTDGQFSISSRFPFESVELITVLGTQQELYNGLSRQEIDLRIQDYPPGKYYLRCKGPNGQSITPIVLTN